MKRLLLILLGLVLAASVCAAGPSLGTAKDVVVLGRGVDAEARQQEVVMCSDFKLSVKQATSLLNRAAIVSQQEIHDHYDYAPCFVKGTAFFHGYPVAWEIRAGGTGSITLSSDETLPIVDEKERNAPE